MLYSIFDVQHSIAELSQTVEVRQVVKIFVRRITPIKLPTSPILRLKSPTHQSITSLEDCIA